MSDDFLLSRNLGKPNIKLTIFFSLLICFYYITGENSIFSSRFTAGHDSGSLFRTGFDLINNFAGGNSLWSPFDLSSKSFVAFGMVSNSIYSLPISIVYFITHKLIPTIPENYLYRNVFIFTYFPLVTLTLSIGFYAWLSLLRINNLLVSILVIPLSVGIFQNEILGFINLSPTISLLPYLLIAITLIFKNKFKSGIFLFLFFSIISFVQTPLLFFAYVLVIPWVITVIYGILKNFFFYEIKIKLLIKKLYLNGSIILFFSLLFSIPKIINNFYELLYSGKPLPNLFKNNEHILQIINNKNFEDFFDLINSLKGSLLYITFDNLSKLLFALSILILHIIAFIGIKNKLDKNFDYFIPKINLKNTLYGVLFFYLLYSIFNTVLDLKINYFLDSSRLDNLFDFPSLATNKIFPGIGLKNSFELLTEYNKNQMLLKGDLGFMGYFSILFTFLGALNVILSKNFFKIFYLSILITLVLLFSVAVSWPPLAPFFYFPLTLIYPFSVLQNNFSMINYFLDYLTIPFFSIGISWTYIKICYFIPDNNYEKINLNLQKIIKLFIFIPTLFFAIKDIKYNKIFLTKNNFNYDKLEPHTGIIANKKRQFLLDVQNPLLKSTPINVYRGQMPIVKKTYAYPEELNNYGTKQELVGEYYKTLFLSRYMDLPGLYEIRHKSLSHYSNKNQCERIPYNTSWKPNQNCDLIGDKNNWPNTFFVIKNNSQKVKKSYLYSQLPSKISRCNGVDQISCFYINQLNISISYKDFLDSGISIQKGMIGLRLPSYLAHISTNLFINDREILLESEDKSLRFVQDQGKLINRNSFDIGNIKSGYLVLNSDFIFDILVKNKTSLNLRIKSGDNVSLIREVNLSNFKYFINSYIGEKILIATPYAKNLEIRQNSKKLPFKSTFKPINGLVQIESIKDGISKIEISYGKKPFSKFQFIFVNIIISILSFSKIFKILKKIN